MSTPLDPSLPLWQLQHIGEYRGGSALVARVHHCIGDGMSLVPVLLNVADPVEGDIFAPNVPPQIGPSGSSPLGRLGQALKFGGKAAVTMGRLAVMPKDPSTALKGDLQIPKRASWSAALPLVDVKRTGKALGGTVNDVLLSAVAGSLSRYLESRNQEVPADLSLRAVVPFNLRRPEDSVLGNKFGLVFLSLPLGIRDPVARTKEVHQRMLAVKTSPEPVVAFGLQEQVLRFFGQKATAVMTNVPGPREYLRVGGVKVDGLMFWVPQSGQLGLGVSILSYADQVRVGIATDVGLIPDPEALTQGFQDALDELQDEARKLRGE
jgi:WS/DGAT/MGAT family acyltransferase